MWAQLPLNQIVKEITFLKILIITNQVELINYQFRQGQVFPNLVIQFRIKSEYTLEFTLSILRKFVSLDSTIRLKDFSTVVTHCLLVKLVLISFIFKICSNVIFCQ